MGRRCLHVCYDCLCLIAVFRRCYWFMIGLLCLHGLGLRSSIAEQLPGKGDVDIIILSTYLANHPDK